ncbi:hypothetical protein NS220_06005 [Microbacterium testaceum]|uniref:Uncharacterized protein n=1 Tax=Microbacterium testaceum TaxID=2033 RepID=A0A147EYZ4_MICTE|nr:hypothetical protein [Microbacterium testaceum]KTR95357.1 hypothetical protein NS220_06005 [Microbacterium testaceum]
MNHRTVLERADHSGFHMVVNGRHPVGYCADHAPHETEAEARECFGQYQRDRVRERGQASWTTCMLKGCTAPARRVFEIEGDGYALAVLCEEHATKENAMQVMHLDGPAGDAWFS